MDAARSGLGLRCEWAQHWSGHSSGIQAPGRGWHQGPRTLGHDHVDGEEPGALSAVGVWPLLMTCHLWAFEL